ncbi:hypothetical protein [Streptomyces mirabilis]|uniref:hypothetical protein n=1 Tax=Streptomyces mirabilis TaxID=68239 RepID=UPI003695B00B
MNTPRIPEVLTMTAAGLTALSNVPKWVAFAIALPPVLTAMTRSFIEVLASVSRFRTASMRRRQEDRLLSGVIDSGIGLGHLERVERKAPPSAGIPAVDPALPSPPIADPPPGTPP